MKASFLLVPACSRKERRKGETEKKEEKRRKAERKEESEKKRKGEKIELKLYIKLTVFPWDGKEFYCEKKFLNSF